MSVIDELELVRLYRDDGYSLANLADSFGWSATAIRKLLIANGVVMRTPWHAADCSTEDVKRLYVDEGLSTFAVAARLGCSDRTVIRRLESAGIKRREDGSDPQYVRSDFSGDLAEMAYLIGFRIGDLHVDREGRRTIVVKCTSSRTEQIGLFRQLFEPYGHVYTDEAGLAGRKRQSVGMEVRLNLSFEFLLPKPNTMPEWVLANDDAFFAFFAGYIDA